MMPRSHERERLDDPALGTGDLHASLRFMETVNRLLGGAEAVRRFLDRAQVPDRFTVLDLGTGSGDIPEIIVEWAARHGKAAEVTAIDTNAGCLAFASRWHGSPAIRYRAHSAFESESLGRFDYVVASMFFHHLDDGDIVAMLARMRRQARRGFLVNDLERGWVSVAGAALLGALSRNDTVSHDARLSVRRAFTAGELREYARRSGAGREVRVERRPVCRLVLSCA